MKYTILGLQMVVSMTMHFLQVMDLLHKFANILNTRQDPLFSLALMRGFQWSHEFGLQQLSATSLTFLGLALVSVVGDFKGGSTVRDPN